MKVTFCWTLNWNEFASTIDPNLRMSVNINLIMLIVDLARILETKNDYVNINLIMFWLCFDYVLIMLIDNDNEF